MSNNNIKDLQEHLISACERLKNRISQTTSKIKNKSASPTDIEEMDVELIQLLHMNNGYEDIYGSNIVDKRALQRHIAKASERLESKISEADRRTKSKQASPDEIKKRELNKAKLEILNSETKATEISAFAGEIKNSPPITNANPASYDRIMAQVEATSKKMKTKSASPDAIKQRDKDLLSLVSIATNRITDSGSKFTSKANASSPVAKKTNAGLNT